MAEIKKITYGLNDEIELLKFKLQFYAELDGYGQRKCVTEFKIAINPKRLADDDRFPKRNAATLEPLKKPLELLTFSASGGVWLKNLSDLEFCGQCLYVFNRAGQSEDGLLLKTLAGGLSAPISSFLVALVPFWDKFHLNDTTPGTDAQSAALANWFKVEPGKASWDYTACCDYLKTVGLYEDRGYKYGHSWLQKVLDREALAAFLDAFFYLYRTLKIAGAGHEDTRFNSIWDEEFLTDRKTTGAVFLSEIEASESAFVIKGA